MCKDATFDDKKRMYAHPLIGIFSASSNDAITAPQKEICSTSVRMINSNMKLKEVVSEHMITHLLQLCKRELGLSEVPNIMLLDTPTVEGGTSFGQFDGDSIQVVVKNRHPVDIMRTLAHELVHWAQSSAGMELDGSDGSSIENQANAIAGVIMRKFGKMYPQYFMDTMP
jgi:Zn-dependent peptidase ImmA (M78 family)